jgi:hypothetical protein
MPSRNATALVITAAALAAPAATAGLVGSSVDFRWIRNSTVVDAKTFVVSSLMPEYYYSTQYVGSAWGAMGLDVRNASMTFTADFADSFNVFLPLGTVLELAVPASMRLEAFNVGSMSGVTGLDQSDLSIDGNVLRIAAGGIQFNAPGATFTLNFESTLLPGPGAVAALAAITAMPRRRRG